MSTPWFEIDVLPVGEGERSGDAIAMRYSLDGVQWDVLVIDGGNQDSGAELVKLIRTHYGTNRVNHVLNTHPDADHASGLRVVLEEMEVGALWMHQPWAHSPHILNAFDDGRITTQSLGRRIEEALRAAKGVYDLAVEKRVPVFEPFQGSNIGGLLVLSPSRTQYQALLPHFRSTPETSISSPLPSSRGGIAALLAEAMAKFVPATPLTEDAALGRKATAAENESSVVLFGRFDEERILFTGDAGTVALNGAAQFAASVGLSLQGLRVMQAPHHGSRNNLSAEVLRKISARFAFVSVAAKSTTHPRRSVTNALQRRGTAVYATQGTGLRFEYNVPARPGWGPANAVPWHELIEAA